MLFDALQKSGNFFDNDPNAQNLLQSIMRQVSGEDQPFTQGVVNNMLADSADSNAASYNSQRQQVNRAMANAGLTGSGLEGSALSDMQSKVAGSTRAGRRDIQTRSQLENYNAKTAANTQAMNFLAQQAQQRQAAAFQEAGYRSQMNETGDASNMSNQDPAAQQAQTQVAQPALSKPTPARPVQFGLSNKTLLAPSMNTSQFGGTMGGVGGTPGAESAGLGNGAAQQANAFASYQQQVSQQTRDRQWLQQQQMDWDSQYGGRG